MSNNQKTEDTIDLHDYVAFKEFVDEFKNESDRAAVILGAARLDYLLYQILTKYLLPNVGSRDELLDGDSPLATFSAKINMVHRLGLINPDFARALHLIRKIRNSFAHEVSGCKLDSGPQSDRIRELVAPFIQTEAFKYIKRTYFKDKAGTAANFHTLLVLASVRLEGIFERLSPLTDETATELCPKGYKPESQPEA
jgi:hypothetical protein